MKAKELSEKRAIVAEYLADILDLSHDESFLKSTLTESDQSGEGFIVSLTPEEFIYLPMNDDTLPLQEGPPFTESFLNYIKFCIILRTLLDDKNLSDFPKRLSFFKNVTKDLSEDHLNFILNAKVNSENVPNKRIRGRSIRLGTAADMDAKVISILSIFSGHVLPLYGYVGSEGQYGRFACKRTSIKDNSDLKNILTEGKLCKEVMIEKSNLPNFKILVSEGGAPVLRQREGKEEMTGTVEKEEKEETVDESIYTKLANIFSKPVKTQFNLMEVLNIAIKAVEGLSFNEPTRNALLELLSSYSDSVTLSNIKDISKFGLSYRKDIAYLYYVLESMIRGEDFLPFGEFAGDIVIEQDVSKDDIIQRLLTDFGNVDFTMLNEIVEEYGGYDRIRDENEYIRFSEFLRDILRI